MGLEDSTPLEALIDGFNKEQLKKLAWSALENYHKQGREYEDLMRSAIKEGDIGLFKDGLKLYDTLVEILKDYEDIKPYTKIRDNLINKMKNTWPSYFPPREFCNS